MASGYVCRSHLLLEHRERRARDFLKSDDRWAHVLDDAADRLHAHVHRHGLEEDVVREDAELHRRCQMRICLMDLRV